jgi:hypothetical protein
MTTKQKPDNYIFRLRVENLQEAAAEISDPAGQPVGGTLSGPLRYPEEAANVIRALHGKAVRGLLSSDEEVEALGEALFNVLFNERLRFSFLDIHEKARKENALLRLELDINERIVPDLAALPWEFMRVPPEVGAASFWLATTPDMIFSRRRARWQAVDPIQLDQDEALRIALVVSAPIDQQVVEYEAVHQALKEMSDASGRHIKLLNPIGPDSSATPEAIDNILRQEPHIFHFIGHGDFPRQAQDQGSARIALQDGFGAARWRNADDFADLFRRHVPGVVLLQSCEGAALSSWQAFTGTASQLVDQNVPIVIAMQYQVSNITASRFAVEFYKQLAAGAAVDAAVQEGRRMISLGMYGYDQRDFATPVLFMRARQGYFFTDAPKDEPPSDNLEPGPEVQAGGNTIVNTGGGAYIGGSVHTGGGAFVGRDQISTETSQPSGGAAAKLSAAKVRELAAALLECSSMRDASTRDAIVDMLPGNLAAGIKRSKSDRLDTTNILKACLAQPGAAAQLLTSLRFFEGDSFAMRAVAALAEAFNLQNR